MSVSPKALSLEMTRVLEETFNYHFIVLQGSDEVQQENARSMATVAFNAVWKTVWNAIDGERRETRAKLDRIADLLYDRHNAVRVEAARDLASHQEGPSSVLGRKR